VIKIRGWEARGTAVLREGKQGGSYCKGKIGKRGRDGKDAVGGTRWAYREDLQKTPMLQQGYTEQVSPSQPSITTKTEIDEGSKTQ